MLEKQESFEIHRILEDGRIHYRKTTAILDNGKIVSKTKSRGVLKPGDDTSGIKSDALDDIKPAIWTEKRVKAWQDKRKKRN